MSARRAASVLSLLLVAACAAEDARESEAARVPERLPPLARAQCGDSVRFVGSGMVALDDDVSHPASEERLVLLRSDWNGSFSLRTRTAHGAFAMFSVEPGEPIDSCPSATSPDAQYINEVLLGGAGEVTVDDVSPMTTRIAALGQTFECHAIAFVASADGMNQRGTIFYSTEAPLLGIVRFDLEGSGSPAWIPGVHRASFRVSYLLQHFEHFNYYR